MQNKYFLTPLYLAVYKEHLEIAQLLLNRGCDVNKQDNNGKTLLHWAASHDHLKLVKFLLDSGADINKQDDNGETPLHWAACQGHLKLVKFLLDRGADLNLQTKYGYTPLHWSAVNNHLEIVQLLLDRGADIDLQDTTDFPLMYWDRTAKSRQQEIVKLLSDRQAIVSGSKAGRFSFLMAQQDRVGADSPAHLLCQDLFREIFGYLMPSVLVDDQHAVEDYRRIYREQQRQVQGWCAIN